jgi:hypothetical protein
VINIGYGVASLTTATIGPRGLTTVLGNGRRLTKIHSIFHITKTLLSSVYLELTDIATLSVQALFRLNTENIRSATSNNATKPCTMLPQHIRNRPQRSLGSSSVVPAQTSWNKNAMSIARLDITERRMKLEGQTSLFYLLRITHYAPFHAQQPLAWGHSSQHQRAVNSGNYNCLCIYCGTNLVLLTP